MHMAKATKTIRLPIEVTERLEEEDNQSVAVEDALRDRYDLWDSENDKEKRSTLRCSYCGEAFIEGHECPNPPIQSEGE